MTPKEFVKKWSAIQQKEQSAAQTHFNDVCALVGHLDPLAFDPEGKSFTFETRTDEGDGRHGRADVWFKGKFIWEYKSPKKDLDKAYQQLLRYREALDNPPLLVTSDTNVIIIHTNFTGTVKEIHEVTFERIIEGDGVELLRRVFYHPDSFEPAVTKDQVTEATAATFLQVADAIKQYDPSADPEKIAHFLVQLLFTVFAEDMELLPDEIFTQLVKTHHGNMAKFSHVLQSLFTVMRSGGWFGIYEIPHFNGDLFDHDHIPDLPSDLIDPLLGAADQNWANINPTIFGTLFERIIDEGKRAQLGAHYTSVEDIMLIVEPVLMEPLREKWDTTRRAATRLIRDGKREEAHALVAECAETIADTTVLDPACGSGNFLYVALQELLGLQKAVIAYAESNDLEPILLTVSPHQLYGIEINPYAHELAQITIWIGYIQWRVENGLPDIEEPILRPLNQIDRKDAILAYDEAGNPVEPVWPAADVIIGNPPFLGGNKIRQELGDDYVDTLFELYDDVPSFSDLVCYWFDRARQQLSQKSAGRIGLVATNSISGGVNKRVLERIKHDGDIFLAWSDNRWVLDGAAVRIAIIGFDDGSQQNKLLDGNPTQQINPDLTGFQFYVSGAKKLMTNANICFMGASPKGPFDIEKHLALSLLQDKSNDSSYPNRNVIKHVVSATDIVRRSRNKYTIDFGLMTEEEAQQYVKPYEYVKEHVYPVRSKNRRQAYAKRWWLYAENRPGMRVGLAPLGRYIATPAVAKHRLFVWMTPDILCNQGCLVFAREDDYFLGVLQSRIHELWALHKGTYLGKGNDPRYTPTTTFETFSFPFTPGSEPSEEENEHVRTIAESARALVTFRQAWLHPPAEEIGVTISEKQLKKRTLTNLYNALTLYRDNRRIGVDAFKTATPTDLSLGEIEELDDIHQELDRAVLSAYGWPHTLADEQILEKLLALNLERAEKQMEA